MIAALLLSVICNALDCQGRDGGRVHDFVWENDKFGMRAYGPGDYHVWSGLDVFNKNTSRNVCIEWMLDPVRSTHSSKPNLHDNLGEGMDNYTLGASRGVGGVALFADGEWKTYPDWEACRRIHVGDDYLEFELVYPSFSAAGKMTYHITLRRGERFFRNDVSFERMPAGFFAGPGIDLEPKRDHKGSVCEEPGFVSIFEDPKGTDGRDGSTMAAILVADPSQVTPMTDHLNCRVLAFKGRKELTYWAGASWSLAGEITTADAWHEQVRNFLSAEAATGDCGIQSRIDAASEAGGGVVTIAPGRYADVRPIVLKSNVTLDVQEGAVIQAGTNSADYAFLPGQDRGAFISAIGATNVAIVGGGRIECSGDRMPKLKGVPGRWRGIHLVRCRGVRLEDVTLANAHSWGCYLQQCEDVAVRRMKIVNHANFNNDGLDLEVRNAIIEDCDIDSDDDSIVLKNHDPNFTVENVEVRRCRVGGNTNSLKIGTETAGDFRNILIHDCIVSPRRNSAVSPLSRDVPGLDRTVPSGKGGIVLATVDGGTIDGVTVRNIVMEGVETPIYIRHGRRRGGERESALRNVLIENVKAKAVSRIACSVTGVPGEPKRRPENIVLRNVALDVPGGTDGNVRLAEPVPECEQGYPSPRNFLYHLLPACGVYVRHADGVKLENVTVSRRAADSRPDIVRDDAP